MHQGESGGEDGADRYPREDKRLRGYARKFDKGEDYHHRDHLHREGDTRQSELCQNGPGEYRSAEDYGRCRTERRGIRKTQGVRGCERVSEYALHDGPGDGKPGPGGESLDERRQIDVPHILADGGCAVEGEELDQGIHGAVSQILHEYRYERHDHRGYGGGQYKQAFASGLFPILFLGVRRPAVVIV